MSHPDHALWQQGWRANHIDFHLDHIHPLLARHWASLGLAASDRVFVPLCGKSLDLMWLHDLGHDVAGIELSPVAIRAFFKASRLQPTRRPSGDMTRWMQDRLDIYCGDFFDLTAQDLHGVRAVYDRAALTALPEAMRAYYVAHLHAILPDDCHMLLLTVEDMDDDEVLADIVGTSQEIIDLYAGYFSVELIHSEHHPARFDLAGQALEERCQHKAYRLQRQGHRPG